MPDWIIPNWPVGFDAWLSLLTLINVGQMKIYRGCVMEVRARMIDQLGWSIILFDLVFGILFMLAAIWTLYPELMFTTWMNRFDLIALNLITAWQTILIHRATTRRIQRSVGPEIAHTAVPIYRGPERRVGPADRRQSADIYGRDRGEL